MHALSLMSFQAHDHAPGRLLDPALHLALPVRLVSLLHAQAVHRQKSQPSAVQRRGEVAGSAMDDIAAVVATAAAAVAAAAEVLICRSRSRSRANRVLGRAEKGRHCRSHAHMHIYVDLHK